MKLLGSTRSPFVCKVRLVALEKGIDCEFVTITPWDPAVAAVNPLAKVPVLVRSDDRPLYDSVVIAEYFDSLAPQPRLIPENLEDRLEVRRWEALADGVLDAVIAISHEDREPPEKRKGADFYERQQKKFEAGLARMDADLANRDYCHGGSLTLADIACGSALLYLDRIRPDAGWRDRYHNLAGLLERLARRESFKRLDVPK